MPIDVTVKEPGSRIIRDKTDGHIVSSAISYGHDVAPDRIHEIRHVATRNPHNIEFVAVQMYRMGKTRSCSRVGEAYFYNLVRRKFIDASVWQEL